MGFRQPFVVADQSAPVAARDAVYKELMSLRNPQTATLEPTVAPLRFDWTFRPGVPIRIVCGKLDNPSHTYTNPQPNYTDLLTFADVDGWRNYSDTYGGKPQTTCAGSGLIVSERRRTRPMSCRAIWSCSAVSALTSRRSAYSTE
jgi:hypothetical protein